MNLQEAAVIGMWEI